MAKYTSQTCHVCGTVDAESRVTRDQFICTNCTRVFHADVNAAWNILYRAAGNVVLRRPGHKEATSQHPPCSVPYNEAVRKGMVTHVYNSLNDITHHTASIKFCIVSFEVATKASITKPHNHRCLSSMSSYVLIPVMLINNI